MERPLLRQNINISLQRCKNTKKQYVLKDKNVGGVNGKRLDNEEDVLWKKGAHPFFGIKPVTL